MGPKKEVEVVDYSKKGYDYNSLLTTTAVPKKVVKQEDSDSDDDFKDVKSKKKK